MSKVVEASCAAGIVTVSGIPVPTAEILSEGIGPSDGLLIMDEDEATYVTSNAQDLKSALDQIATALTQIATALTLVDAKPIGPLPPAPAATTNITAIIAAQAQIAALKEILK